MNYSGNIERLKTHNWLGPRYNKLRPIEKELLETFLIFVDGKTKDDAMKACNRMFLDQKNPPRNWTLISELCSCAISMAS